MIISASYKTDIPAFYGPWLMQRLQHGYCKMINPYGGQIYTIDLSPEQVDGIIFWTKNINPFMRYLPEVERMGYPFLIHHTINGYPRALESRVVDTAQAIASMQQLAATYSPERLVWRYDPILFTSLTPPEWHLRNFEQLARALQGTVDEVIVSFAYVYKKSARNISLAAREQKFSWHEHSSEDVEEKFRQLLTALAHIARAHGMQLRICAQKRFLVAGLVEEARCIDSLRLARVAGRAATNVKRQIGGRPECACGASKDIGAYDTCPHGCVYCYAVQQREKALQAYKDHDPAGEFLFPPEPAAHIPAVPPAYIQQSFESWS